MTKSKSEKKLTKQKMLSPKLITQLTQIIKDNYGIDLTPEETLDFGNRLTQYVEICYKVLSDNQNNNATTQK